MKKATVLSIAVLAAGLIGVLPVLALGQGSRLPPQAQFHVSVNASGTVSSTAGHPNIQFPGVRNVGGHKKGTLRMVTGTVRSVSSSSLALVAHGKDYEVNVTSATNIVNRVWKKISLNDVSADDKVRVFGRVTSFTIDAQVVRDISLPRVNISTSTATPPVAPTPAPTTKPTPAPVPVPTSKPIPTQSKTPPATLEVFVMQDDGTLVQSGNAVDVEAVSRKFYSLYPNKDNYDFLNIFTTFVDPSKPHLHYLVRNNVTGIGMEQPDLSSSFGSPKLLGINFFNTTYTSDQLNSSERAIKSNFDILDHELSHQWLMRVGRNFGFESDDNGHYGRWANTGFIRDGEEWVDTNGGFVWKDNQNGTLSIPDSSFSAKRGFSKLSLYLMGLVPSSDVLDLEVVVPKDPTDKISRTIVGIFKKVSITDIITKYGERNPSYQNSQKNFKMAYILLSKKGETPAQYQLNAINYIAQNYPSEWNYVTYGKSTINQ